MHSRELGCCLDCRVMRLQAASAVETHRRQPHFVPVRVVVIGERPHRRSIIEDEQRVKSVSELPFSPLPHGNPGPWTEHVVREISSQFKISPDSLPSQLIVQLGICEEGWPYIRKTKRTYHQFLPDKKNARKNLFGILFSFQPRRLLPDKHRTQSNSPFFWAHNTSMHAAINILQDEELVRPSKSQMQLRLL